MSYHHKESAPGWVRGIGIGVLVLDVAAIAFIGGPGVEIATADGRTYSVVVPDPAVLRDAVEQARTASAR